MAPTTFDMILACIYGIPCIAILIAIILPINWHYDPKDNDPYRYCPKEEN